MKTKLKSLTRLLILTSLTACSAIPLPDDLQRSLVAGAKDSFFKAPVAPDIVNTELDNEYIHDYVTKVGKRVQAESSITGIIYYEVVDSPIVQGTNGNHFIHLTTAMLNMMESEAELACFLGHEIHHGEQDFSSAGNKSIATGLYENFAPDAVRGMGLHNDLQDIGDSIYSKGKETDADEQGSLMCARAGYDAYALARLQTRIAQEITLGKWSKIKNIKGSHEQMKDRADHLNEYLAEQRIPSGKGKAGISEFSMAMSRLAPKPTQGPQRLALKSLNKLSEKVLATREIGNTLSTDELVQMISALSKVAISQKVSPNNLGKLDFKNIPGDHFMEEEVYNSFNRYGTFENEVLSQVFEILDQAGFLTFEFDDYVATVDFYAFYSGYDFYTGHRLSKMERKLRLANLLKKQRHSFGKLKVMMSKARGEARDIWGDAESLASITKI